jgi:hypothetical protein
MEDSTRGYTRAGSAITVNKRLDPFGFVDVVDPKDIETAFREASKGRADALLRLASVGPLANFQLPQVAELAVKSRLSAIYTGRTPVEAGGLMELRRERDPLGPAHRYVCGLAADDQCGFS